MTASELLAKTHGITCQGACRCFYCGAPADVPLKLSSSFIDWWSVAEPESTSICRGCELALDEKITLAGKDKQQKTRNYSWLITADSATPLTKANKSELREILLAPPPTPWALALADSGQKHVIYRTPVNVGDEPFSVQLDAQRIIYSRESLQDRLTLAYRIVAGVGHKGAETPGIAAAITVDPAALEQWIACLHEPLTKLALFLTPSQKECQENGNQQSKPSGIPAPTGGSRGRLLWTE